MGTRQYEKPFVLDIPFDEALHRFSRTNPKELAKDGKAPKKPKASSKKATKKVKD
jgi:hypothetical protein